MKFINPFLMNDWPIKRFLIVVLSFQLFIWFIIFFPTLNWPLIGFLRPFLCLIYLVFIPGVIALRILQLHEISYTEVLLYGVGLSLSILMCTGAFINTVYSLSGISYPISLEPLSITIGLIVIILCIICSIVDKNYSKTSYINIKNLFSFPALFILLIPVLTILGTFSVNIFENNLLLLLVIFLISVFVLSIGFSYVPQKLYPLVIFLISISLLFHRSLISIYITGWDVNAEYYYSNLVLSSSAWTSSLDSNINAMLSIVILPPIFSLFTGIDLTWTFKIIFPLIYSLVPVALYEVFKKQTNETIGFFAAFLFMSDVAFYNEMPSLTRQQIAELFLSLIILLYIDINSPKKKKAILLLIFSMSLTVSHYGTSYLYMAALVFIYIMETIYKNSKVQNICNRIGIPIIGEFGESKDSDNGESKDSYKIDRKLIFDFKYVIFFTGFTILWYAFVASGSPFITIINIFLKMVNTFFSEFMNPRSAQGLGIIAKGTASPLHTVMKFFYILEIVFIVIGILSIIISKKKFQDKFRFENYYLFLSLAYFTICIGGIVIPNFANTLNTSRLYHLSLITLAPFCIIGCIVLLEPIQKITKNIIIDIKPLKLLSLFVVISFLFNVGFVYEIFKDAPTSYALSSVSLKAGNINEKELYYDSILTDQDVYGAKWFSSFGCKEKTIFADFPSKVHVLYSYGSSLPYRDFLTDEVLNDLQPKYIYLSRFNYIEKTLVNEKNTSNYSTELLNIDGNIKINNLYSDGFTKIYYIGHQ